ncbi:tyrosine-type recombinase/integrase [uncultured Methylophaga sp.]|uniref:tyrosine-type recombinase/integrase n=1 Tax=uncultured Methylophaga sp. TaxID=285271 RepID=UPI0030DA6B73|tara:strand:- start:22908 stop:24071 length:1164 start_codon:yes stop_codon:yes gene_type:complete
MSDRIDTVSGRKKLAPRREPYWYKLSQGQYLGYRKLDDDSGRWIARKIENRQKTHFALNCDGDIGFSDAQKMARQVLDNAIGVKPLRYTVQDAIDHYVEYLTLEKAKSTARDAQIRLNLHVPESLKKTLLVKVSTMQVKNMQYKMVRQFDEDTEENTEKIRKSKDSANRVMNMFRATLNMAFRNDYVQSDTAWRKVKNFRGVAQSRKIFWTDREVQNLIKLSSGHFRLLLQAGLYTGARYGELAQMKVADYDSSNKVINLKHGKTGQRQIYLSDAAGKLFDELTRLKHPNASILTQDGKNPWGKNNYIRLFQDAATAARLPKGSCFYCMRHYYISKAIMAKIPLQMIAENCGTSIRMIEKHYGKFLESDRKLLFNEVLLPTLQAINS